MCATTQEWLSSDNVWGSIISFFAVRLGDGSRVIRLGSKQPYSPSHLGGPQPWLSKPVIFNYFQWSSSCKESPEFSFGIRIDNECGKMDLLLFISVCGLSLYPIVEQRLGHTTYSLFFTSSQFTQYQSPNYDSATVIFEVCLLPVWEHPGSTSGKATATLCSSGL